MGTHLAFIIQLLGEVNYSGFGIDVEVFVEALYGVGDTAVDAGVCVGGTDVKDNRTLRKVLLHAGRVREHVELRRVVVDVQHLDSHLQRPSPLRRASIGGDQPACVSVGDLSVEGS